MTINTKIAKSPVSVVYEDSVVSGVTEMPCDCVSDPGWSNIRPCSLSMSAVGTSLATSAGGVTSTRSCGVVIIGDAVVLGVTVSWSV